MRVGLDASAVPARPAGAGRYIVELAQRLPTEGVDLTVATRHSDAQRWRQWSPHSRVEPVVPNSRVLRLGFEAYVLGSRSVVRDVDVWHSPHYSMPHRARRPVAVTVHDMTFFTNPEWHERSKVAFFRRAIRYAAREADVLIAVSEFTARLLRDVTATTRPVVVAPHGVDLEHFTASPHRDSAPPTGLPDVSRPYVFFVGTLEPRKGVDVLLDAFADVAANDDTIELWLAGQDGWGVDELRTSIERHPYRERIQRLGYVDDDALPWLLRAARVVAYPSRGEGFGLPVLEALACGASVVTTSDTVMAEVAGDAATLVAVGDASALAEAIGALVREVDEIRAHRAVRARARAEEFTWQASMTRHIESYQIACQSKHT